MSNTKKFLEGELRYVEGLTSVDGFLKSIASELVKREWVDYKNNQWSPTWSFNENREIELKDSFNKDNVKLFKSLATTETAPSGIAYGRLQVLTGVNSEVAKNVNLTLNSETYSINLELGDNPQEVAQKIVDIVKLIDGFEDTKIDDNDARSVIITGASPVFTLEVDSDATNFVSTELITFSQVTAGVATGKITILSGALGTGSFTVTLNGEPVVINITTETDNMIASKISAAVNALGQGFEDTVSDGNVVIIAGETEVVSLDIDAGEGNEITNTITTLLPAGYGTIEVLSEAKEDGQVRIKVDNIERLIDIAKGDTPVVIAQKIQDRAKGIIGYTMTSVLNNVVTISGDTTIQHLSMEDTDVATKPIIYVDREVTSAYDVGLLTLLTPSTSNQILEVSVNGIKYDVSVASGDSTVAIAQKVTSVLNSLSPFELTTYDGNIVRVASNSEAVHSLSTDGEIGSDKSYMLTGIETGGLNMGIITMIQSVEEDTTITVTINDGNHVVSVLQTDTLDEIAEKIGLTLTGVGGLSDTEVVGNVIYVSGTESVDLISVSASEISPDYFDVFDNIIKGVGDNSKGTTVGDNVLIKVIYSGEQFQRVPFLKESTPSGDIKMIARLKSRPKGEVEIYEDTITIVQDEILDNRGEGLYYKFGRNPISQSRGAHKLIVFKNGVEVNKDDYEVDYFNGALFFKESNLPEDAITANYGICTGIEQELISPDKYRIIDDMLIDMTPSEELEDLDIIVKVNYFWDIVHPATLEGIMHSTDRIVLRTRVDVTSAKNKSQRKSYYWELRHPSINKNKYITGLECRYGTALDGSKTTLDNNTSSVWSRFSWYERDSGMCGSESAMSHVDGWLPVHYQMNFTQEYLNIVVQGSPSVDSSPYDRYLISHAYIGALEEYEDKKMDDIQYNFGMTVGGDEIYSKGNFPKDWGQRTGTCKTDITMERTGDGIPFQAHYPSFHTSPEFMDKHFIGASEYTGSNHFSEIVVTHPVQRERGKMQGLIVGDRSSIHHLDELISNEDKFNVGGMLLNSKGKYYNECGGANISQEKKWVMFNINSPYWFLNNSPNVFYGIALRKS